MASNWQPVPDMGQPVYNADDRAATSNVLSQHNKGSFSEPALVMYIAQYVVGKMVLCCCRGQVCKMKESSCRV